MARRRVKAGPPGGARVDAERELIIIYHVDLEHSLSNCVPKATSKLYYGIARCSAAATVHHMLRPDLWQRALHECTDADGTTSRLDVSP